MSGTDNSNFEKKVLLRIEALSHSANDFVLDCYAGKGKLWKEVQRRTGRKLHVTSIEREKGKNPTAMCGDNMKILPTLDLSRYGLIDLDAYGYPAAQLKHIARRGFDGVVVVTWIGINFARQSREVVRAARIDEDFYFKHSTIFNCLNDRLLENFLYLCRAKRIRGYFLGNKKYFYYQTTKTKP